MFTSTNKLGVDVKLRVSAQDTCSHVLTSRISSKKANAGAFVTFQVARVAELADALDSGSSE